MIVSSGDRVSVPPQYFLVPGTARLLPIASNVGYDTENRKFVTTVDNTMSKYTFYGKISLLQVNTLLCSLRFEPAKYITQCV